MPNTVQLTKDGQPIFPVTDASVVTGISDVAKSGDYDDLDNKPTIPTVPDISTDINADATSDVKTASPKAVKTFVEGKGYGTYSKPSGGIPASDLESGVIPTVPTISTNIATDATSDSKTASPKAVKTYVDAHITNIAAVSAPNPADGTLLITLTSGDTITVDLNHDHTSYPKYVLCADETAYNAITNKDSSTLYLIPETSS